MNKNGSRKRSIAASIVAIVLCLAMMMGATLAWFTDSVSSGKNTITAGNLDVGLEYSTDATNWKTVEDATDLFDDSALWEPGHVEYVNLKVSNLGSLALEYTLGINVAGEVAGTNVNNEAFKLSEYLKYAVVDGTKEYAANATGREQAIADAQATGVKSLSTLYSGDGVLYPSDAAGSSTQEITLIVYMPTDVGNVANYKTGTTAPTVSLGINLTATQTPYESDDFGTNYDENAEGPVLISDADELTSALSSDAEEVSLIHSSDIELTDFTSVDTIKIPSGKTVTLDLNGNSISALETSETTTGSYTSMITVANGATLILDDSTGTGSITYEYAGVDTTNWAGKTAILCQGEMVMNGGTIKVESNDKQILSFGIDVRPNAWGSEYTEATSFTMNGGSLLCDNNTEAIRVAQNSSTTLETAKMPVKCTINGGIITGYDCVFVQQLSSTFTSLEVEITGGTLTASNYAVRMYGTSVYTLLSGVENPVNKINITGGTLIDGEATTLPVVRGVAIRVTDSASSGDAGYENFMASVSIESVIEKTQNIPTE